MVRKVYLRKSEEKGVSLIMLIITIAMMAIIVSFAVYNSKNTTPEAKLASAYVSLKSVKDACDNAVMLGEMKPDEYDEYYFFGKNIQHSDVDISVYKTKCGLTAGEDFSERTYIIKPEETKEDKRILENLELKGITSTYVVDLENDNYYIYGGVALNNETKAYEYKEIMKAYKLLSD